MVEAYMFKTLTISEAGFKNIYKYNYSIALLLNNCKDFDAFIKTVSSLDFNIKYNNFSVICYKGEVELKGNISCLVLPISEAYGICIINHGFSDSDELFEKITFKIKGKIGVSDIYNSVYFKGFVSNSFSALCNCLFFVDDNFCFYKKLSYKKCDDYIKKIYNSVVFADFDNSKALLSDVQSKIITGDFSFEESIFVLKILYSVFCEEYGYAENEIFEYSLFEFSISDYERMLTGIIDIIDDIAKKSVKNRLYKYNKVISEIILFIDSNYSTDIKLRDVAERFNLKPGYLSILFKNVYKCTFTQYVTNLRMEKAKDMLQNTTAAIGEIYDEVGYTDYYSFIKAFKKNVGVSPTVYRRNN